MHAWAAVLVRHGGSLLGSPLIPHRARAIELAGAREPRDKGTEGPGGDARRAGGPTLSKIPPRRGADKAGVFFV